MTAHTPDEPYSMWRRDAVRLPWKTVPAILLRVSHRASSADYIMQASTAEPMAATTP